MKQERLVLASLNDPAMRSLNFLCCIMLLQNPSFCQTTVQDSFSIQGKITGKDSGVVILWYRDKDYNQRAKTLRLRQGSFSWKGSVKNACEALLWTDTANKEFDHPSVVRFLLEPGSVSIVYDSENSTYGISGSAAEKENEKWNEVKKKWLTAKAGLRSSMMKLYREQRINKVNHRNTLQILQKQLDSVNAIIRNMDIEFIKLHPNSFLSAYLLDKQKRFLPLDTSITLYSSLGYEVKSSVLGWDVLSYVYPLTNDSAFRKENPLGDKEFTDKLLKVQSVYDLTFTDTSGKQASLKKYSRHPVVLNFWASWCGPCRENMPAWNRLAEKFKDSIVFITVAVSDLQTSWKKSIKEYNVKGALLASASFHELGPVYCKVWKVPTYVIVNSNGQIINYDAPHPNESEFQQIIYDLAKNNQ